MGRSAQPLVRTEKDRWPDYRVYDHLDLYGWEFDADMMISKKMGSASALQGGRVTSFTMRQSGEVVCIFDEGSWVLRLDEENEIAKIAMGYFLTKYNKRRSKREEKELKIL